ncbi:MAG: hypothetical protein V3T05_11265 [Myxococcota bacterium]
MRLFLRPPGLDRLSIEARVIYSVFALFMLMAYASSVWLYGDDSPGVTPSSARDYYLGASASPPVDGNAGSDGGPSIDLPSGPTRPAAASMRFEKPARQVVETFHFHAFTAPLCLLVIAHLFMMCALGVFLKVGVILAGALSTLVHLVAPLLVRFVSPGLAWLVFPSALIMAITWLVMTLWPIYEMWTLPRVESPNGFGRPPATE